MLVLILHSNKADIAYIIEYTDKQEVGIMKVREMTGGIKLIYNVVYAIMSIFKVNRRQFKIYMPREATKVDLTQSTTNIKCKTC